MQVKGTWDECKTELEITVTNIEDKLNDMSSFKDLLNLQNQLDELKSLIDQIPELKNMADNLNSLVQTLEQKCDEINTSLPSLEEQLQELTNLSQQFPDFKQDLEKLKQDIQTLKDEVGQIGGGGSSENWVLIYDKDSEDPAINLGYTTGIKGETYTVNNLPNLKEYKKFKIVFFYNYNYNVYTMETPLLKDNIFTFYAGDTLGNTLISIAVGFVYSKSHDNFRMYLADVTRIEFAKSKYPTITPKNNNDYYYISKIEAST